MRVALISCAKTKLPGVHAAKDLYISPRFKLAWQYASANYDRVYILSAKHGLLEPEKRIRAYDVTLNDQPKEARLRWARKVARQIRLSIPSSAYIEFWCGAAYRDPLMEMLNEYDVMAPFAWMSQGQQLQWLKAKAAGA